MTTVHSSIDPQIIQKIVQKATKSKLVQQKRIKVGEINEVYDIKTQDNQNIILRISRRGGNILEHEQWALEAAAKAGVPTPKTLIIEHIEDGKDTSVCVQEKIEGISLKQYVERNNDTRQINILLQSIGEIVSKIHSVTTNGFGWLDPNGNGIFTEWEQFITRISAKTIEILQYKTIDPNIIETALNTILENRNIYKGKSHLLHRDISPDHILIKDNKIVGFIDFENCIGGDPIYDLANWSLFFDKDFPLDRIIQGYNNKSYINTNFELRHRVYKLCVCLSLLSYYTSLDIESKVNDISNKIQELT